MGGSTDCRNLEVRRHATTTEQYSLSLRGIDEFGRVHCTKNKFNWERGARRILDGPFLLDSRWSEVKPRFSVLCFCNVVYRLRLID